ncbi:MAG: polysaccharide biosynthesis tyrosine autokinase [Verrucomicrobiota bacterium]
MDIQHYLFLFLRHLWLIVLIIAATLAGMWVWLAKQPPVYASRAVLQVEMEQANILNIEDVKENRVTGVDAINTVIQTLSSNTVLLGVAKAIGRSDDWAAKDPSGKILPAMESSLAQSIRQQLIITLRRGTRLIDIVAEDTDPEKARLLAGEVVKQFLKLLDQDRTHVSKEANTFLVNQAKELKDKLEASEQELAKYRLDKNAVSVNDKQNIVVERLGALNTQVTAANTQRAVLESDLAALKEIPPTDLERMVQLPSVAALPQVGQFLAAVNAKEGEFAAIKERYLELHPKYRATQSELNELRAKLETAVAGAGDTLRQQYSTFTATEQRLKDMLAEQEAKALELDQVSIPYDALLRVAESDRKMYETILTRLKETDVTQGLTQTPYRLTEEPLINPIPVGPNKSKSLLTSAVLALGAGIGLVLLLDRLDSSIRTVDEAERVLGLPVLAAVPEADLSKVPKGGSCMTDDPGSALAESFRTLRASLSLMGEEQHRRLILVTSAIPMEGKTFISLNLAASLAAQGHRTLLIDADLRRPSLSTALLEPDIRHGGTFRGLTDILSNLCPVGEAIRSTSIENLSLLPSGRRAPNPAELLSQASMGVLLKQLFMMFDRVVIDSAPINAVSDTLAVAPLADLVCFVVRFGKTPRPAILRALTLLKKSDARMAGLVMSRMPANRGAAYYYYYYGDSYVTDSVYGSELEPQKMKKSRKASKAEV